MIRKIACLVTIGLIFSGINALAADSKKEAAALSKAEKWLALVDSKKYAENWEEASELFKNAIQPQQWVQSIQAVRGPLGDLISRKENKSLQDIFGWRTRRRICFDPVPNLV